jgi:hypothetical protein
MAPDPITGVSNQQAMVRAATARIAMRYCLSEAREALFGISKCWAVPPVNAPCNWDFIAAE